jgi:hypothetical protein
VIVSTLTIDLGPALKSAREVEGQQVARSRAADRPPRRAPRQRKFVVENLYIGGMFPNEPPWLEAKRIDVSLAWSALFHREVLPRIDRDVRLADGGRVVSRRAARRSRASAGRRGRRAPGRAWS